MTRALLAKCSAEFIGTFALVFAGCGAVMVSERFGLTSPAAIPLTFGLVIATMIYAVGHISGAHFNPVVTLSFTVARHFPKGHILPYWLAQFGGGLVAMGFLYGLLPEGLSFGATVPVISVWKALAWEAILTFFLMFVIISVATDTRAVGTMAGAAIGATVMLCALFGGPITGASMNPARTLAPNLFQGELSSLWIYLLGPAIGAVIAALVYEGLRCDFQKSPLVEETKKDDAKGCC